jgi:hypothetical protein
LNSRSRVHGPNDLLSYDWRSLVAEDLMPEAQERPRNDQELRAREDLMRQQFERDADSWEKATPLEDVLKRLKSIFTSRR